MSTSSTNRVPRTARGRPSGPAPGEASTKMFHLTRAQVVIGVIGLALSVLTLGLTGAMQPAPADAPPIATRVIDPSVPADRDVMVIVRPPEGTAAKNFGIKPIGRPVQPTDDFGECSFGEDARGCSADLFDATGRWMATIVLPTKGHLEIRVLTLLTPGG